MDVGGPGYVHMVGTSKDIAEMSIVDEACGHSCEEGIPCTVVIACGEARRCKRSLAGAVKEAWAAAHAAWQEGGDSSWAS